MDCYKFQDSQGSILIACLKNMKPNQEKNFTKTVIRPWCSLLMNGFVLSARSPGNGLVLTTVGCNEEVWLLPQIVLLDWLYGALCTEAITKAGFTLSNFRNAELS